MPNPITKKMHNTILVRLRKIWIRKAVRALACAGLHARDVELVVYGSCSNDETVPNSASGVQFKLGAMHAASMDVNTACTSFLYGLSTATAMIRTGVVKNAVVIGVDSQLM